MKWLLGVALVLVGLGVINYDVVHIVRGLLSLF